MNSKLLLAVLIFCILSPQLKAPSESAVPFLLIGPSSHSSGLTGAQTALPTRDTFGFYYNPGQLGLFAASDHLSFQYLKVNWLPGFNFSDLYFTSRGVSVGRRLQDTPFAVGLGFMRGYLNLGNNVWTDKQGNISSGKGNDHVINRDGFEINIFEIFTVTGGTFSGNGLEKVKTSGVSISSRGIFKLMPNTGNYLWNKILKHVDIRHTQSGFNPLSRNHPLSRTSFQSLSINVYNV